MVGNKSDLVQREEVREEEGREYAQSIGAIFGLVSCRYGIGITELMNEVVKRIKGKGVVKPQGKIILRDTRRRTHYNITFCPRNRVRDISYKEMFDVWYGKDIEDV